MAWIDRIGRWALRSSLLWGAAAATLFYLVLDQSHDWVSPAVLRSLTGRVEAYACVAMFFVALAALVIRSIGLGWQISLIGRPVFKAPVESELTAAAARSLIKQLDELPALWQTTYLVERLRKALLFIQRKSGQEPPDECLRQLAEEDAARMDSGYAAVRFMTWSIPAVGSLGTVLGIAAAVAQLSTQDAADPLSGVTSGLALAFDTTALSLVLSIGLVFVKFACEQQEQRLLGMVDERARRELLGGYAATVTPRASQNDQLRQLTDSLAQIADQLAKQPAAASHTGESTGASRIARSAVGDEQLETLVARAVSKAIGNQPPGQAAVAVGQAPLADWTQLQAALQQIARFFARQNEELTKDTEVAAELASAIQEGAMNWPARKVLAGRQEASAGDSLSGIWSSMAE